MYNFNVKTAPITLATFCELHECVIVNGQLGCNVRIRSVCMMKCSVYGRQKSAQVDKGLYRAYYSEVYLDITKLNQSLVLRGIPRCYSVKPKLCASKHITVLFQVLVLKGISRYQPVNPVPSTLRLNQGL